MVYQIMWSRYISRVYSSVNLETKTAQYMLPPFLGAFWLHVCSTRTRLFWTKGDLSYSQVQKITPLQSPESHHQAPGPLSPLNGGCDQSNCHHSRNPSWGRGEPNQVSCCSHLVSEPFHHPGDLLALWTPANSPWLIWLSGTRSRCDPVSINSTLPIFQLRRVINLCEKGIPMRHKGVNYIHLPSFVTTMFNFVKGILSKKIQNRSKYWWKYKQI